MASTIASIDTAHEDMIHAAQMDYYGKRLATCSSDRTIKIFENINDTLRPVADIKGHEGPVWQVAWAHPKFGNIIASCSYDRKIIVWRENTPNIWTKLYEYMDESSVNSVAFAPHEFGLILAGASSDGTIVIISFKDDKWDVSKIPHAHQVGCNAVSWAPAISAGSLVNSNGMSTVPIMRLVSCGCDHRVKIWRFEGQQWKEEANLDGHTDWVRDVAWAPGIGLPTNTIASCSQDQTVLIWTQSEDGNTWRPPTALPKFPDVVWRVSWSIAGNILAVATGDQNVTLWKESLNGEWKLISQMNESTGTELSRPQEKN